MTNKSMRGKMKKAFACTLSAAVLVSTAAVPTFAADEDATVNAEATDVEVEDEDIEANDADADVEVAEDTDTDAQEDAETEAFDDTEEAEAFDDGTVAEVGDGETKASSKSADLVDMTDKNPIQVTNANISEIMHSELVNTRGKYYQLSEDIELSGWQTAERFGGVLDGNGHTITLKDNSSCFIQFLTTDGALQNIGFLGSVTSGDACVVGTLQGKILNCYVNMSNGSNAGLAGIIQSAVVSNCAVRVTSTTDTFYPLTNEITSVGSGVPAGAATVTNCFWSNDTKDSSKFKEGYRTKDETSFIENCDVKEAADMVAELNVNKGANAVEWVAGDDGYPVLKKKAEEEKHCTVSFTDWHGKKHENVQESGIKWRIQDVPSWQNIGTLEVNGYDGSQGKVVWLLSQYNSGLQHYDWEDEDQSNIWPGFYSAGIAVKGTGTATLIAWAEDTLSHTVDKQDLPNKDSLKLAEVNVEVTSGKVAELRLLANGKVVDDNNFIVKGSEWINLQPQTREDGKKEWENVPVSSITFPKSTKYKYESLVTNTRAKYRAKKPGSFELKVSGYDKTYTLNVTSEYVPVESIKPSIEGTVVVYPSDYDGDASQNILGTALTSDVFNGSVKVTPYNASYATKWTMGSNNASIAEYTKDAGGAYGIIPKKVGEVTLTATSADSELKTQVSGSTTVKFVYADEVAVAELQKAVAALPEADAITKDNEAAVSEARFIYDNMSEANKEASANEVAKIAKCEEKLDEIKKSEDTKKPEPTKKPEDTKKSEEQKPEVKAEITLNYNTLPLAVKQSTSVVKIKSTAIKGDTIKSAKSSNKKVAAVSVKNGKLTVKGLKKGTAVVTVTSANGATAKVTFKVQKKAVALKKLSATVKRNCVVTKGKKATLKVIKTPVTAKGTVKWTSSNKKVATVSSKGVVTAKKKGTATITAKVGNKKVTFKVTVK